MAFPHGNNEAAPKPQLILSSKNKAPFPTNAPWMNFVLNEGGSPELVTPYLVQVQKAGAAFGYPTRQPSAEAILQPFVADLLLLLAGQPSRQPTIDRFDKMSVTVSWYGGNMTSPLVRGSPYLTFQIRNSIPQFVTVHSIQNVTANSDHTKHKILLHGGQTWLMYSSSPLLLSPSLQSSAPFSGTLRVAILPPNAPQSEPILDQHSHVYPLAGDAAIGYFNITYGWEVSNWKPELQSTELLMLTLPLHRGLMGQCSTGQEASSLRFNTIDGDAVGWVGSSWQLAIDQTNVGWYADRAITDSSAVDLVRTAVRQDVGSLSPIGTRDTYFYGKAVARAARLALIAEEVGAADQIPAVTAFLERCLTPWMDGSFPGNSFLYDPLWGGVVSGRSASDASAEFGAGLYNDHHFHFGYFLYAAAVLTKFNSGWGRAHRRQLMAMVGDIFSLSAMDPHFTQLRHFDPFLLHSWASGLTEFTDGRNQESGSEAVNAYYAVSLLGLALGDLHLAVSAATVAALEAYSCQALWHVRSNSSIYDSSFTLHNRIVGVLWSTKRDSALWFAPAQDRAIRLGIQVLPITPFTQVLFSDREYTRQLVEWVRQSPGSTTDAWNGFVVALKAVHDPTAALKDLQSLRGFDDGNSLSNLLWWIHTR